MLKSFGKIGQSLLRISVLNAVTHAMFQVSLKDDLPDLVKRALCRIDLNQDIFTWNVFINHLLYRIQLTDHFPETQMQLFRFHTLFHNLCSHEFIGVR